jgi:acetyl esterase/lipase
VRVLRVVRGSSLEDEMLKPISLSLVLVVALVAPAAAQPSPDLQASVALFQKVRTVANVVYVRANGWEGKLDIYAQRTPDPAPTVIFIHGGGWVRGTKEASVLTVLPYIAMGYSVVNVEYRLGDVSPAPAAIEDCRCALRWVVEHAKEYNIDASRLIVAGASAGGHLALTTGMLPTSAGFDRSCQTPVEPRVAAIVNFFGITDVADLMDGPNKKPFPESWPYTVQWLGNQPNRLDIAKAASPLLYVRAGVPPTISIHGDADPLVPYTHSVRLQEALKKAGVVHEFITVPGGGHGNFPPDQWQRVYAAIEKFLATNVAAVKAPSSAGRQ